MEDDRTWVFNAPQHYCDLPAALQDDDQEQADRYFFAKCDDTVYYEPSDEGALAGDEGDRTTQAPTLLPPPAAEERTVEEFPVIIRRRSRSVGSRPLQMKQLEPKRTESKKIVAPTKPQTDKEDTTFADGLRQYMRPKGPQEAPRVTKPVPFNLTAPRRRPATASNAANANPSMAEGVVRWEKKTPDRFHSTRHGQVPQLERVELQCTQAHTPQLSACKRHRPVHALSRDARERLEVEEMKKNQFKANPLDEKVFKAPTLPARAAAKPTKVEPFHLSEPSQRKENVPPEGYDSTGNHEPFHARPVPRSVLEPPPMERRPPPSVTVPQTPKFSDAGKASLQNWRRQRSKSNGSMGSARSNSSKESLVSSSTVSDRPKATIVEPFSFETRDRQLQERRQIKIQKMIEEEKKQRQFQATPCPNFSQPFVLERATLTATRPAPFQLSCDTRGLAKKDKFVQQLEQMRLEEQKAAEFKAQPARVLGLAPFRVKLDANRAQAVQATVTEFQLSTGQRAAQRKNFDQFLKMREQENEAARRELELLKQQKEEEEAMQIRQETNFVANPVRRYRSMVVRPSNPEDITIPKTPKFMKNQSKD